MNMTDHPMAQAIAATTTIASITGVWPIILAIPAAIYYILIIIEKVTGKSIAQLLGFSDLSD